MNKRIFFVAAISVLIAAGTFLSAIKAEQNGVPQDGKFNELTLELDAKKNRLVRLEPIPITFTLSNQTEREIPGHAGLALGSRYLDLYLQRDGGEMQKIDLPSKETRLFAVSPRKIKPGERFQSRHLLNLNLEQLFPDAGVYRMQIVFKDDNLQETVKSNIIEINITEPKGADLEAFNYLSTQVDAIDFLESATDTSPEKVSEFVARFGDSSYAPYAIYQLGQFHFLRGDYPEATRLLGRLAGRPDFIFSDRVRDYLNKSKDKPKAN